ncbi:MAG: hypothetical protein RIS75_1357 [Actinomycetota bacterium]
MTSSTVSAASVHTAFGEDLGFASLHPLSHGELQVSLSLSDERIASCDFHPGFMHRGDEKLLEVRTYRQGLSLINRHQWLSPAAPETAFAQACEELMGLVPPPRAVLLRELVCHIQIVTGILLRLAGVAQTLAQPWRPIIEVREQWLDVHEVITGVRMHSSAVRLGGVSHDCSTEDLESLSQLANASFAFNVDLSALSGLGVINEVDAAQRIHDDINQISQSCTELQRVMGDLSMTHGPIASSLPKVVRVPVGSSYKEVQGANGMTGVWLHSDGGTTPHRVHLNTPSFRNLELIEQNALGKSHHDLWAMLLTMPLALGEIDR